MDQQATVSEIERRAWKLRVPMVLVCSKAGIASSTFFRWKKTERNPHPTNANLKTVGKLQAALDAIEKSQRRKPPGCGKAAAA